MMPASIRPGPMAPLPVMATPARAAPVVSLPVMPTPVRSVPMMHVPVLGGLLSRACGCRHGYRDEERQAGNEQSEELFP